MCVIEGDVEFSFDDKFTDPVDMRALVAWLKESPNHLTRFIQLARLKLGVGDGRLDSELVINPDKVSNIFRIISDLAQTPYPMIGKWWTRFSAEVLKDRKISQYKDRNKK